MEQSVCLENSSRRFLPAEEQPPPDPGENISIPFETLSLLQIIAQRVGGDFGMKVRLGTPGQGSFFNTQTCEITLDPLHVKDNPSQALFVAFHEGMHRRLTPGMREMGLNKEEAEKLFDRLGFQALYNSLEDTAINTAGVQIFPGMEHHMREFYDEQLAEENAELGVPEVFLLSQLLGYWPKFAKYCSELIRDWHQRRQSNNLDQQVVEALNDTKRQAREVVNHIPAPHSKDKKEIIARARERLELANEIFPHLNKLIAMDREVESYRQMMQEFRRVEKEIEKTSEALNEAWKNGENEEAQRLEKELAKLKRRLDPWSKLSEEAKKALKEALEKALRQQLEAASKELEKLQQAIEAAKKECEKLEEEIEQLKQQLEGQGGDSSNSEQLQSKQSQLAEAQGRLREAQNALDSLQAGLANSLQQGSIPLPYDSLPDDLKKALKDLYESLSPDQQTGMNRRAQEQLEKIEDAINEEIKSKLEDDGPPSHSQTKSGRANKRVDNFPITDTQEYKKLTRELRRTREGKESEYIQAFRQVSPHLNGVYRRLEDVFIREKHTEWIPGYSSGSKANLDRAMQAQADPNARQRMWLRRVLPGEKDEAFVVLIDVSGSMQQQGKYWETFKATVLLAELFERLGTPVQFLSFSDDVRLVKGFQDSIQEGLTRERFDSLIVQRGGTNDVLAIKAARLQLISHPSRYKFVLMLSDAGSNYSGGLRQVMAQIEKERRVVVIHFGVGLGTEDSEGLYPYSYGNLQIKITPAERRAGTKDFCQVLCEVVEDIVLRPDDYLEYRNARQQQ